jgi:hypothetical protein
MRSNRRTIICRRPPALGDFRFKVSDERPICQGQENLRVPYQDRLAKLAAFFLFLQIPLLHDNGMPNLRQKMTRVGVAFGI